MAKFIEVNVKSGVQMINIDDIASFRPFTDDNKVQTFIRRRDRWNIVIDEDYRNFTDRLSALADISYTEDK